jgi:hypothetical protein
VIQADLALDLLEGLLDRPPCSGHPDQPDKRRGGWAVPLLEEPGLVHHQHRTRITQVFHHAGALVIEDPVGIPVGAGQQPLHGAATAGHPRPAGGNPTASRQVRLEY